MTGFAGSTNIVTTVVNGALETGGNLATIASRLISSGAISAANLLSSINDRLYSGGSSAAAWLANLAAKDFATQTTLATIRLHQDGYLTTISGELDGPVAGTSVFLATGVATAETGVDIAAGEYLIRATTDITFAITAAGGGGSAVWCTSPGIYLGRNDTHWLKKNIFF